jgi:hypothetical protein
VDLSVTEKTIVALYKEQDQAKAQQLAQNIRELSDEIKNSPMYLSVDLDSLRNLLAYLNALKQLSLSLSGGNSTEQVTLGLREQLT